MPMVKKTSTTAVAPAPAATAPAATPPAAKAPANGTAAAVSRLKKSTVTAPAADKPASSQGRDFAEEARGKTRCVQFEAALMSPAIAGMKFGTMDEYLDLCETAAKRGVAFTFGETK